MREFDVHSLVARLGKIDILIRRQLAARKLTRFFANQGGKLALLSPKG
jgi:hypothetical protein